MTYESINPYTQQTMATHTELSQQALADKLALAEQAFRDWKETDIAYRAGLLLKAGETLTQNQSRYAELISQEMGKTLKEALAEVQKCAWVCNYYAEHAAAFLAPTNMPTDASESYVRFEPLGCIMAIMPWNFPFWQVFRFAAPTLTAGNVGVLKHAKNVFGCGNAIEAVFEEAGYPAGVFQHLVMGGEMAEQTIGHPTVKAVTLTGSERAGAKVAAAAGKHIKKSLLELGGSNAFVVLADADIEQAVTVGLKARFMNAGQSCIAAKRFILDAAIAETFTEQFMERAKALVAGDPSDDLVDMGPLARKDLAEGLQGQVDASLEKGARLLLGGKHEDALFAPTLLDQVRPGMKAFDEETFGPVAAFITAKNEDEAIRLANATNFGLGDTIFTTDPERAKRLIPKLDGGAVFVNELVKSDPRLPFGGTKISGYGRELSRAGMMEFVNVKTVYIR